MMRLSASMLECVVTACILIPVQSAMSSDLSSFQDQDTWRLSQVRLVSFQQFTRSIARCSRAENCVQSLAFQKKRKSSLESNQDILIPMRAAGLMLSWIRAEVLELSNTTRIVLADCSTVMCSETYSLKCPFFMSFQRSIGCIGFQFAR
jgi:hypothetical protein